MSIIKRLALRHLKQNKSRSILTVLGITISVVMLTVIFTCATSFAYYYGEKAVYSNGDYHFYVKTSHNDAKKYLESDPAIKSVGMTPKGFKKTILLESAFYGLFGLLLGVPLSLIVNRIVDYIVSKDNPIPFEVNIPIYVIACISIFLVIGLTMIYSLKLIKNNSIIETLKEDTN